MDELIHRLDAAHGRPVSILTVDPDIRNVLPVTPTAEYPLFPVGYLPATTQDEKPRIASYESVCQVYDLEERRFAWFLGRLDHRGSKMFEDLNWHYPLALASNQTDVQFRQQAVAELIANPQLYERVQSFLGHKPFEARGSPRYDDRVIYTEARPDVDFLVNFDYEGLTKIIADLRDLSIAQPSHDAYVRLINWANAVSQDTLMHEMSKDFHKKVRRRLVTIYSGRSSHIAMGLLKPGINLEDVIDILPESATSIVKKGRKGKEETRRLLKYSSRDDMTEADMQVAKARAQFDVLHTHTRDVFSIPVLFAYMQLKELYQGAQWHAHLANNGIAGVHPTMSDSPGLLEAADMMPINMLLHRKKETALIANSYCLDSAKKIIVILGPNYTGKSEWMRTLHLSNYLGKRGFTLPCRSATIGTSAGSHFHVCSNKDYSDGSEGFNSMVELKRHLPLIKPGDTVFLDELGNATNGETAYLLAKNLTDVLQDHGCRVVITTHHREVARIAVDNAQNGTILGTHPGHPYKILSHQDGMNFFAEQTVQKIGATKVDFKSALQTPLPAPRKPTDANQSDRDEEIRRQMDRDLAF